MFAMKFCSVRCAKDFCLKSNHMFFKQVLYNFGFLSALLFKQAGLTNLIVDSFFEKKNIQIRVYDKYQYNDTVVFEKRFSYSEKLYVKESTENRTSPPIIYQLSKTKTSSLMNHITIK